MIAGLGCPDWGMVVIRGVVDSLEQAKEADVRTTVSATSVTGLRPPPGCSVRRSLPILVSHFQKTLFTEMREWKLVLAILFGLSVLILFALWPRRRHRLRQGISHMSTDQLLAEIAAHPTSRAVSEPCACADACAELATRNDCTGGKCICEMPSRCEPYIETMPNLLDKREEECNGCGIKPNPTANPPRDPSNCTDDYLDRNLTDSKCEGDMIDDCQAACDEFSDLTRQCNNAFCGPLCRECSMADPTVCDPEPLDALITACHSAGGCALAEIRDACAVLAAKDQALACQNAVCMANPAADGSIYHCTTADVAALVDADCAGNPLEQPCQGMCTTLAADRTGRYAAACARANCEIHNDPSWACCRCDQLKDCDTADLDEMTHVCEIQSEFSTFQLVNGKILRQTLINEPGIQRRLTGSTAFELYLPELDRVYAWEAIGASIAKDMTFVTEFALIDPTGLVDGTLYVVQIRYTGDSRPTPVDYVLGPLSVAGTPNDDYRVQQIFLAVRNDANNVIVPGKMRLKYRGIEFTAFVYGMGRPKDGPSSWTTVQASIIYEPGQPEICNSNCSIANESVTILSRDGSLTQETIDKIKDALGISGVVATNGKRKRVRA